MSPTVYNFIETALAVMCYKWKMKAYLGTQLYMTQKSLQQRLGLYGRRHLILRMIVLR